MTSSDNELSRLPRELAPPPGLEDRVVASLRSEGLVHPGSTWTRKAAVAAAAVLVFAGGYALGGLRSPGPTGSPTIQTGDRYAILLYEDDRFVAAPEDDPGLHVRQYGAWAMDLLARGALDDAGELAPEGLSLRPTPDGGPTEMPVSPAGTGSPTGFFIVRAPSWEAARELALSHPHLANRGRVDVHPVVGRNDGGE